MRALTLVVLVLAAVALAAAAPAPDWDDSAEQYDYDDYAYDDDYEEDYVRRSGRLPFAIFSDTSVRRPSSGVPQPSPCTWGVVQCCDIPNRMADRNNCFARLGCTGAWFTDLCTPAIKQNVFKMVLTSLWKH